MMVCKVICNDKLSVNINKIALIRNSRKGNNPSLEFFSKKIIESGAHGITVHPRPDLRHIRPDDLSDISLITKELDVEFNMKEILMKSVLEITLDF